MQAKTIKLSDLHLNTGQIKDVPKNPRFIKDERYEALKKSIEDDPEMLQLRELVAYDNNGELVVILGNMRYRAMKELGYKDAPVKVLPAETDAKKLRAYIQKDNIAFGQNDWDLLGNEWDVEELQDFGLECEFLEDNENVIENEDEGENDEIEDFSSELTPQYKIEISFDNEEEQEKIYNELTERGLSCRILTL
jgi:ParB-like chromosome segregation protein Spo0J